MKLEDYKTNKIEELATQLEQARTDAAHWRGECLRLAEMVTHGMAQDNFESVRHAAERILADLDEAA